MIIEKQIAKYENIILNKMPRHILIWIQNEATKNHLDDDEYLDLLKDFTKRVVK